GMGRLDRLAGGKPFRFRVRRLLQDGTPENENLQARRSMRGREPSMIRSALISELGQDRIVVNNAPENRFEVRRRLLRFQRSMELRTQVRRSEMRTSVVSIRRRR